jgi:hypothetical protein
MVIYKEGVTGGNEMADGYTRECERLETLAKAMAIISEEIIESKDAGAAAAGHVLSTLIMRQIEALDHELDIIIDKAGI